MATVPKHATPLPDGDESFRDGLGVRCIVVDATTGDRVERLVLTPELARQALAVEERTIRLVNFRHARFARLRGVEADVEGEAVWVSAEPVDGIRWFDVLLAAEQGRVTIDVNTALQLAREILPALATLHDSRSVTHGALGPERLVLTPQARLTIVDHGLGVALGKLQYPRTRLWREFRIAVPPAAGVPRFDARADVAMVAMTVLASLLGRPITLNEFPDHVRELLDRARERPVTGRDRAISPSLRAWLERTLPIESRRPLSTALEAQVALEEAIKKERAYAPGASALKHFVERLGPLVTARPAEPAGAAPATPEARDTGRPAAGGRSTVVSLPGATSRRPARRPTPEEEEAEEIAFLEQELARLAAEEAAQKQDAAEPAAAVAEPAPATPDLTVVEAGAAAPEEDPLALARLLDDLAASAEAETAASPAEPALDQAPASPTVVADVHVERLADPGGAVALPDEGPAVTEILAEVPLRLAGAQVVEFSEYGAAPSAIDEIGLPAALDFDDLDLADAVEQAEEPPPALHLVAAQDRPVAGADAQPTAVAPPVVALASDPADREEPVGAAAPVTLVLVGDEARPDPSSQVHTTDARAVPATDVEAPAWCLVPPAPDLGTTDEDDADLVGTVTFVDRHTLWLDFDRMHAARLLAASSVVSTAVPARRRRARSRVGAAGAATRRSGLARSLAPLGVLASTAGRVSPARRKAPAARQLPASVATVPAALAPPAPTGRLTDIAARGAAHPLRLVAASHASVPLAGRTPTPPQLSACAVHGAVALVPLPDVRPALGLAPVALCLVPPVESIAHLKAAIGPAVPPALPAQTAQPMPLAAPASPGVVRRAMELVSPLRLVWAGVRPQVAPGALRALPATGDLVEPAALALVASPVVDPAPPLQTPDAPLAEPGPVADEVADAVMARGAEVEEVPEVPQAPEDTVVAGVPEVGDVVGLAEPSVPTPADPEPMAAAVEVLVEPAPVAFVAPAPELVLVEAPAPEAPVDEFATAPVEAALEEPAPPAPEAQAMTAGAPALHVVSDGVADVAPDSEGAALPEASAPAVEEPASLADAVGRVDVEPAPVVPLAVTDVELPAAEPRFVPGEGLVLEVSDLDVSSLRVVTPPPDAGPLADLEAEIALLEALILEEKPTAACVEAPHAGDQAVVIDAAPTEPTPVEPVPVDVALAEPTATPPAAVDADVSVTVAAAPVAGGQGVQPAPEPPAPDAELELALLMAALKEVEDAEEAASQAIPPTQAMPAEVVLAAAPAAADPEPAPPDPPAPADAAAAETAPPAAPAEAPALAPSLLPAAAATPGADPLPAPVVEGARPPVELEAPAAPAPVSLSVTTAPVADAGDDEPEPAAAAAPRKRRSRSRNRRRAIAAPAPAPLPPVPAAQPAAAAHVEVAAQEPPRPSTAVREAWSVVARRADDPASPTTTDLPATGADVAGLRPELRLEASPTFEETLPTYAPWLAGDPLPAGAAEASPLSVTRAVPTESERASVYAPDPLPTGVPAGGAATPVTGAIRVLPAGAPAAPEVDQPGRPAPVAPSARETGPDPARGVRPPALPWVDPSRDLSPSSFGAGITIPAESRSRLPLVAAVIALLVLAAAGAYWMLRPAATGKLTVEASALGIEVLIDGHVRGIAPVTVEVPAGRHEVQLRGHGATRSLSVDVAAGGVTTQRVNWSEGRSTGSLRVTSTPQGAKVLIGGELRGVTPVEVVGLAAGQHTVTVQGDGGSVRRSVHVTAGVVGELDVPISPGWLKVIAPFTMEVREDGQLVGSDDQGRLMLSPGTHRLEFSNATYGLTVRRSVEITPYDTTSLTIEAPTGAIEVKAPDGMQVFIDGTARGVTPLPGPLPLTLGTYNVLITDGAGQIKGRQAVTVKAGRPTPVTF